MTAPTPDDPLAFMRDCVARGAVYWTHHVGMRIAERSLGRAEILGGVESWQIIESYPEDRFMPSYLVLSAAESGKVHVVVATDVDGGNIRVVTAYRPDPARWADGFTRRIVP